MALSTFRRRFGAFQHYLCTPPSAASTRDAVRPTCVLSPENARSLTIQCNEDPVSRQTPDREDIRSRIGGDNPSPPNRACQATCSPDRLCGCSRHAREVPAERSRSERVERSAQLAGRRRRLDVVCTTRRLPVLPTSLARGAHCAAERRRGPCDRRRCGAAPASGIEAQLVERPFVKRLGAGSNPADPATVCSCSAVLPVKRWSAHQTCAGPFRQARTNAGFDSLHCDGRSQIRSI
jgi:hypothetical protein